MLRSDLFDYSDAYIFVKRRIIITSTNNAKRRNKKLTFKNNVPFTSCISKIDNTFVDNAEDLDIVILIYDLLEYSHNYSMTSGSLWNYYKDEVNGAANENDAANNKMNNKTSKSSEYKTKLVRNTSSNNSRLNAVVVPLKYLSDFL